ncbi:MAG: patatin-like phospholipase family protein [Chloroflexi bacterium]|nr:patatin-like phospholipase family protein [Chloroflexota bacterium]
MRERLRKIPFFSTLRDEELDAVAQRLQCRRLRKGASVFQSGEPDDSMYFIESGLVKIVSEQRGEARFILYLGPGNFFGEGAALFGGNHSASVYVVIDAEFLLLSHADLLALLAQYPPMAMTIIRELHARLRRSLNAPIQPKEMTVIAVIGDCAPMLAEHLAQVSAEDVALLDLGGSNQPLDPATLAPNHVYYTYAGEGVPAERLPAQLSELLKRFYWALLWIPPVESPLVLKAVDQSDLRVVIGASFAFQGEIIAPRHRLFANDTAEDIHRVARRLARRQIGLALSSGNARGIAHIGVLKVLREENIPLDMISGTSAGAFFGAMFAAGRPIDDLIKFAGTVHREYNPFTGFRNWDVRLPPRSGLIKGDALLRHLRTQLEDKAFAELQIPFAVVTADLVSGEEIVFERGPLAQAVRASMSIGGLLEPVEYEGRFLIDGGATNPVPTRVLGERGMSIIIASSVIPTPQDRLRLQRMKRDNRSPNLVDVMLGEREIMESEIIRSRLQPLDVLIAPDVARYHLREYDKVNEIIQAGEDAARIQVPYIRKLLAPRPRKNPAD